MTLSDIIQNLKKLPEYGKQLIASAKSKAEAEKAQKMLDKATKTTQNASSNISTDLGTNIKNIFQPVAEQLKPTISSISQAPAKTKTVIPTKTDTSDLSPFEKVAEQMKKTQQTQEELGEMFRAKPASEQWKDIGRSTVNMTYVFATVIPNMVYEIGASIYDAYKNDIVSALTNKDVESITRVKQLNPILGFITGNPEGKFQTIQGKALSKIGQGENPYLSLAKATGETIMDGLVTMGMANKISTELAKYYPNEAKMKAWVELGMPANTNELEKNFNKLAFQYHPDRPNGNEAIYKEIGNSYYLLKNEGIPSTNQLTQFLGKVGKTLTTSVKDLEKIPDIWTKMPSAGVGETAVPKLQLPGYATVGEPQPTVGLQTQPIEPVGKEIIPLTSQNKFLVEEAKKYKTPEEFINTLKKQGKIFYHGTPYKFDEFDISKVGERGITEGRGFYFTDRPEVAKGYMNKPGEKIIPKNGVVIEAYLDIKNPMSVSQRKITDNQLTKIVSELSKTNDSLIPSYGDSVKDVVDALKTNDTDVDIISELGNVGVNAQEINNVVQKITGYDGVIKETPYGKIIVAFNPSQIKTKSQLIDIWNKVHKELKQSIEVKPISKELEQSAKEIKQEIKPEIEEKELSQLPKPEDMLSLPRGIEIPKTARALKQQYNLAAAKGDWEKAEKLAKEWINVLPSSKKKFKMYARSEDWDEIMRPMLSPLPNNIRQAIKTIGQNIGASGISSLRSMGEAGNKLADKLETVEALSSIQSGDMKADIKYKTNISKMNDDELKSVTALAEGRQPLVDNENVRQVFDMWNKHRSIIGNIAQNMQVSIVTKEGDIFQFVPKENYFPHFIRTNELLTNPKYLKEVIDYQVKTGGFKSYEEAEEYAQNYLSYLKTNGQDDRFINSYAKDNNMSPAEANFILRRYIFPTSVRKYGNLERAREINLKLYDPNPLRVLESFYDNVWRRLYEIQEFGQNNDIAFDLITKIGQDNYDWELAQRIFDVSMNKVSFNKSMEKAMSIFTDVETVKLTTSQILQITQQSNIAALTGYKIWLKGFKKAFSEVGKEEALRAGAMLEKSLYEAISGVAKHGFGEEYLRRTGFTVSDNFNRITTVNCARELVETLMKNPKGHNYYLLKKLLITPDRVNKLIERGSLTEEDLRIAQFRLSKITQFTVRPEDLPPEWRNNLMVKSMVLYKSFSFQQAKFIKDFIFKNPEWLLRYIPVAIITAELANDIKSFIKGKKRPTKLLERTIEDLVTVGTFGMITDVFESANYAGGIARYIVGPIWGDAAEITESISSLITEKKAKPIAKKSFEYLPYLFPPSIAPYVGIASQPIKSIIFPPKKTSSSTDTSILDLGGGGGNTSILDLDLIK